MLKAGAACLDITPPRGTPIPGYFEERRSRAVHDPLTVKCLALDREGQGIALVLCDLIGARRAVLDRARDLLAGEEGLGSGQGSLSPDRVLVACTHTHTGAWAGDDRYRDFLIRRIADAVAMAWERREPAEVGWGRTNLEGLAFNRRYRMKDGSVQTNPGVGNPEVVEPAGPIDPELGVLVVRRPGGTPLGVWASYSLHYIGIPDDRDTISADYFGAFAEMLQRLRGERFVAALSHGPSGDINNIDVMGGVTPRNDRYQHVERVGARAAAAALWVWNEIEFHRDVPLGAQMAEIRLPRRPPPTDDDHRRARAIQERLDQGKPITMAERGFLWRFGPWKEELPDEVPTWVQAVRIGDLGIVSAPGELFCELGLDAKRRSPYGQTIVIDLANDSVGYLPSRRAFDEGGYEVATSPFAPGVGEQIIDAGCRLLEGLRRP